MTVPGLAAEVAKAGVDIPHGVDPKRLKKTLVFSNWPLYIDYAKQTHKYPKLVTTVDQLLFDRKLKGKVTLLDSIGDTLPVVVLSNGDDPTKIDDAAFNRALRKIERAKRSGQIRKFTGNDYIAMFPTGDV